MKKWVLVLHISGGLGGTKNILHAFTVVRAGTRGCLPAPTATTAAFSSFPVHHEIQVFDNVFSSSACKELHHLAVDHAERCESSIVNRSSPQTPLEHVLIHLVDRLEGGKERKRHDDDDSSFFIEYWSRDEYMNIDAHRDVDEGELETDGVLRYPDYSHVLYLQVSTKGPTCILLDHGGSTTTMKKTTTAANVVTVPAVQGRLLRFPGNLLHAVPKPPHRWLMTAEEERAIRKEDDETAFCESDDIDDDDDSDHDDVEWEDDDDLDVERSVLLFNTWSKKPPRNVQPDRIVDTDIPDGIDMDEADVEAYIQHLRSTQTNDWREDYGPGGESLLCNVVSSWKLQTIARPPGEAERDDAIRVSLMGKRGRRLQDDTHALWQGSGSLLRNALEQDCRVDLVPVQRSTS